jgi:holdfast attachment protein HfaA
MAFGNIVLRRFGFSALGAFALTVGTAGAVDFSNSATYNAPVGMQAGQENAPANASLRDQNGNLTVVNGQFKSDAFAQGFAQSGASASASSMAGGVGNGGSGSAFGGATAIGNSLNVVTVGNGNTVIVNSTQTNKGNITATNSVNGHK